MNLNWKDKFSDKSGYNIGLNVTTIHNKVLKLQGRDYIPSGFVRGGYSTRTQVGHPIGSFYGYEISGVYKSETEALQDPVNQNIKDKGFFKYKDQNGDKVINESDKVFLGSSIPWLIAGIDLGLNFGQYDFSLALQGQVGNKILNAKRMNRDVFVDGNYDQDFYENRWTPDKNSTKYPSAEAYNFSFIQQANDFFVESGSYVRFHFFNDNSEWLQMDKAGHATTAYNIGSIQYDLMRWCGVKNDASIAVGSITALGYMSIVEVLDGFSSKWGFSKGDMVANIFGAALFASQQKVWNQQRISLKFSFHPSLYVQYYPSELGKRLNFQNA